MICMGARNMSYSIIYIVMLWGIKRSFGLRGKDRAILWWGDSVVDNSIRESHVVRGDS
jgi:hypothetical protein